MVVEAVFVLPIVIFVVFAFIYLFEVLSIQSGIQQGLSQTANGISIDGCLYHVKMNENEKNNTFAKNVVKTIMVKNQMNRYLSGQHGWQKVLHKNISYKKSDILTDGETIDLVAEYKLYIPVIFLNIRSIDAVQRVRTRAFIGTNMFMGENNEQYLEQENDEYVYITENGVVYHRDPQCSHLYLSVHECDVSELNSKRNRSGGKYYPCERCCKNGNVQGKVYITDNGSCYHTDRNCPGLKRTVKKVLLSSVKNLPPCKKCGGVK